MGPARRLLQVLGQPGLPEAVFERILATPLQPSDLPFLVHRAPSPEAARRVLDLARNQGDRDALEKVEAILRAKG